MDLVFDIPRLHNFIHRTEIQRPFHHALMCFSGRAISIILAYSFGLGTLFELEIKCERPDWQLSSMTEMFSQQLPLLSHVEELFIKEHTRDPLGWWIDDPNMDSSQWLELFHLFVAVKRLTVSKVMVTHVAPALKELRVAEGIAVEVLPALRDLYVEGLEPSEPVWEAIQSFVTSRQLSNYPVVVQSFELPPNLDQ
jgi:hypothetical protein